VTAQPHAHVRFRPAIERRALWLPTDNPGMASYLRIEERDLEAGGLT